MPGQLRTFDDPGLGAPGLAVFETWEPKCTFVLLLKRKRQIAATIKLDHQF
jgi:hypothetical protein